MMILARLNLKSSRRLLFAWAVIGLDPVAVRIDDEGRIVIVAVDLPQTGRAVVLPARLVRGCVKRIDRSGARRGKADMQARFLIGRDRPLGRHDPEENNISAVAVSG